MIYCISFITVFFIGIAMDLACGPEPDPYDYYISFFHNNLQKNDGYQPFYFNGYTFLNGYIYENEDREKETEKEVNAHEWTKYLGNGVKQHDVRLAMYGLKDSVESALYNKYLVFNKLPDSLKNNTFLKNLVSVHRKPALLYYLFAQGLEHVTKSRSDQWDPLPLDSLALDKRAKEALAYAEKEKDDFLKLRYYYQTQRLLQYSGNEKAALKIYGEHIANVRSNSHVMGWALSLKAGEELRLGHSEQAAYLFSRIFANYPERRVQAYYSFLYTKVRAERVIERCRNNAEKASVYAIAGFHNPRIGLKSLKKVYYTDPRSPLVGLLLCREINKIEEGYLTPRTNGSKYYDDIGYWDHTKYDSLKASFINYIPRLKAFCGQLAAERKYAEPGFGNLASAYLSWIQHDTEAGFTALAELKNEPLRGKLFDEKQMINLLLLSQSIEKLDTTTESKLLPSLLWLDKKVQQERVLKIDDRRSWGDYDFKYYSASSRDFYAKVLARLYFKQKDTAMAALCILRSERTILTSSRWVGDLGLGFDMPRFWQTSMHSYHFEKILKWEHSSIKTRYLSLLMKEFHEATTTEISSMGHSPQKGYYIESTRTKPDIATVPAIYDLLGTSYLREHKYNAAVNAFKHVDVKKLERSTAETYEDVLSKHYNHYLSPFTNGMHDYIGTFSSKRAEGYNKLVYAEIMAKLQRQIKTNPKIASKCYYKMANGLYNTSYYGNLWNYTAYSWASADKYRTNGFYYDRDYLRERTAETWFLKARQLSNDPEFKARCTFMAAKCRQKKIPVPESEEEQFSAAKLGFKFKGSDSGYDQKVRNNPYFKELKDHYLKTAFYKVAVNECSYLRDFLNSENKK